MLSTVECAILILFCELCKSRVAKDGSFAARNDHWIVVPIFPFLKESWIWREISNWQGKQIQNLHFVLSNSWMASLSQKSSVTTKQEYIMIHWMGNWWNNANFNELHKGISLSKMKQPFLLQDPLPYSTSCDLWWYIQFDLRQLDCCNWRMALMTKLKEDNDEPSNPPSNEMTTFQIDWSQHLNLKSKQQSIKNKKRLVLMMFHHLQSKKLKRMNQNQLIYMCYIPSSWLSTIWTYLT